MEWVCRDCVFIEGRGGKKGGYVAENRVVDMSYVVRGPSGESEFVSLVESSDTRAVSDLSLPTSSMSPGAYVCTPKVEEKAKAGPEQQKHQQNATKALPGL